MLVCDAMTLIGIRPYHKAKVHAQSLDKLQLCSFQRSQSLQQLQKLGEFLGDEQLTEDELELLLDLEDEDKRRGNFVKAFPLEDSLMVYGHFFERERYQNRLVVTYLTTPKNRRDKLMGKYQRVYADEV